MSRPCLVVVEHTEIGRIRLAAPAALARGLRVVAVVPDSCPDGFFDSCPGVEVLKTADFALPALRALLAPLARDGAVAGVATPAGAFREGREELLAADVAALAREFGCPAGEPDSFYAAHNKVLMRERLDAAGVPSARHALISSEAECEARGREVGYPCITKPVTAGGSAFVRLNRDAGALRQSYRRTTDGVVDTFGKWNLAYRYRGRSFDNTRHLLCEEYLDGPEFSVELLCAGGRRWPLLIHEKLGVTQTESCVLEPLLFTPPASLDEEQQRRIGEYAARVCEALGLDHCLCHLELRLTARGPVVLEVNPRLGAAYIKENLETVYGLSYGDLFLAHSLKGEAFAPPPRREPPARRLAMSVVYTPLRGRITELAGLDEARRLPGVAEVKTFFKPGDRVDGRNEELFLVMARHFGESVEELERTHRAIEAAVRLKVEP